jgi:mannose-6-phosphate isomerase-like protein (cupin superfamily)
MRPTLGWQHLAVVAVISAVVLTADSVALAQSGQPPAAVDPKLSTAGLVLQEAEGELRVRRPRGNGQPMGIPTFIIKVDRKSAGSSSFFMGMEDIPPGKKIRLHHHPHAEEILFVHRGSGMARLGAREVAVSAGATVFIPRNVSVGLHNTGTEPLSLVFVFPEADGMSGQMRSGSVGEGEDLVPFTPEQMLARDAAGSGHIVFDEPLAP